jgi:branched-chain amino acid transport system ATP-binding protein
LVALNALDFELQKGEILGLIGPNGSGKTTLFNVITGFYSPEKGTIAYGERDITGWRPDKVCRLGIGRTFQLIHPFTSLDVFENVKVAAIFGRGRTVEKLKDLEREVMNILKAVHLDEKCDLAVDSLTIADLRHLELARALATNPEVLLLDEVLAGLTPVETEDLMETIKGIRERGVTIFIIEHVMKAIMGLSDRIMVLDFGAKIAEGDPQAIAHDRKVIEAYLGEEDAA